MKFCYRLAILSLVVASCQALHNCTSFKDKNHGVGCELRNVKPGDENFEISVMARDDTNQTDADIEWVQIRDSQFDNNLPKGVFEKFVNMEKIMILNSIGFKRLNESYFDKKIKLVLMKNTDLEYVGENCLVELENLITLSLNYNNVSRIHKKAFRDLVNLNKIEMVNNQIESLDEDLFANNVNLKLVLLYNNKLKVIPSQLFARNINLESLQLQNNAISQVEKGFHTSLKLLTRADFSQNLCISETIVVSRYVQWSNYINKFKDCFNNFALMKSTNDIIGTVQKRIDVLDEEVKEAVERVNGDMKIIEGKLENNSTFEEIKTNLLKFYKDDQETMKATYEKDLNNITSSVRRDMEKSIEAKLKDELNKSQKTSQEKLVSHDFSSFRDEFSGKFSFIYTTLFLLVCFVLAATAFIVFKMGLFPVKSYSDTRHLIQSEHC